jgi:hypothetical protein
VPVAGGTEVLGELTFDRRRPEAVLDLTRAGKLPPGTATTGACGSARHPQPGFHVKHGRGTAAESRPAQSLSSADFSSAASRSTRASRSRLSVSSSQVASTPSSAIPTMSSHP